MVVRKEETAENTGNGWCGKNSRYRLVKTKALRF